MSIKPILFNTDMVRAIMDGRKNMTRRVVRPKPENDAELLTDNLLPETEEQGSGKVYCFSDATVTSPPYQPGDILYVRETYVTWHLPLGDILYCYKATDPNGNKRPTSPEFDCDLDVRHWKPSIHMPKEAARIFLKVKDVRVERLQEITEEQVYEEGFQFKPPCLSMVSADGHYCDLDGPCTSSIKYCDMSMGELFGKELWDSTIKKSDIRRYGWDANPWVWVIEFERCDKPEGWCKND